MGELSSMKVKEVQFTCNFFERQTNGFAKRGCNAVPQSDSRFVTCSCNHTTMFAVMLSIKTHRVPDLVKIISYVTLSTSVFCLILSIGVLLTLKEKLPNDRIFSQINMASSLALFMAFCLFDNAASAQTWSCELLTVLKHYFILTTAMWMTLEAVVLFIMTTNSALAYHSANQNKLKMILVSIGWGIPALFVISSAGSGFSSGFYMAKVKSDFSQIKSLKVYTQCWIDANVVFYAVGLPLACSLMINLAVSIRVTRFVQQVRLAKRFLKTYKGLRLQVENMKTAAKCNILLLPVFGIPWVFMYFSGLEDYNASIPFMYLNSVLNGLQGVFLMMVYCIVSSDVRNQLLKRIRGTLPSSNRIHESSNSTPTTRPTSERSIVFPVAVSASVPDVDPPPSYKSLHI